MLKNKQKALYIIIGILDIIVFISILISLFVTKGEYFWGIIALVSVYVLMVLAASIAQHHNHNGIFKNPKIGLGRGFAFNLMFLFVKPI